MGFADSIADQTWLILDMLAEDNMSTKSNTFIRKALYGILLLTIVLATFGASKLPAARAQEAGTETPIETPTEILAPTETPTETLAPTNTATATVTSTPTATPSETPTPISTPTNTPTATPTDTPTATPTPTDTPTPTATYTPTPTAALPPLLNIAAIADSFRLPLDSWSVLQDFGVWNSAWTGYHLGQDAAASIGTPVYASGNGIVRYAGYAGGYAGVVIVEHTLPDQSKACTLYGHLTASTIQVSPGQQVSKGQVVGYVANPVDYGYTGSPHLHFGIRRGGYDSQNYNYHLPNGTWHWTWAYLGYTRNANLTQTQKLNYDVNHAQMRGMWHHPYHFIYKPSERNLYGVICHLGLAARPL